MEELKQAAQHYFGADYEKYKQRSEDDGGESVEERYIRVTKRSIRTCNVCSTLLPGFYFCCSECEFYSCYNLCVNCYYDGTFEHEHDSFADNHSILTMFKEGSRYPPCVLQKKPKGKELQPLQLPEQQTKESDKGKGKEGLQIVAKQSYTRPPAETKILDMGKDKKYFQIVEEQSNTSGLPARTKIWEEKFIKIDEASMKMLARIAKAHYDAAPERIRKSADEFFWSMVKQKGKTSVILNDFLEWMNENGYTEYAFPELFQALVKDGNLGMSMSESRTVYYILLSGRPFCSWCNYFIPDIYFCCSKCSATSYALCLHCYESKAYLKHKHYGKDGVFFLDYTVLHTTIKTSSATSNPEESGFSTKIVKKNQDNLVTAWNVVKATLKAGNAVLTIASALGSCTIM